MGPIYPRRVPVAWDRDHSSSDHGDLAGEPADALERYAVDESYEVIVVGCRGMGLTKLLLASCASKLARTTTVPVLLVPASGRHAAAMVTDDAATAG